MRRFASRMSYTEFVGSRTATVDKHAWIVGQCSGKDVLDVGCADHAATFATDASLPWLHRDIKAVANSVLGVDILPETVQELRSLGFNVVQADVETLDLGQTFDVIVAGDLIEHLGRPASFLERARSHLAPSGRLVLTTPNPFSIEQSLMGLVRRTTMVNQEHLSWFDPQTLWALAEHCRYDVVEFAWLETRFQYFRKRNRLANRILHPLAGFIMEHRPLLRRDFGVVLQVAGPDE